MAIRYVLPVALTVLLVVYMFKKVNFSEMLDLIKHGVDYWWILLAMGISVFSHVFRAARWRLQLSALGIKPPFMASVAPFSDATLSTLCSRASEKCGGAPMLPHLKKHRSRLCSAR